MDEENIAPRREAEEETADGSLSEQSRAANGRVDRHRDERHDSGSKGPRRNGSSLIAALWLRLSESSCRSRSEESGLRMSQILPLALLALGRGLRLPLGQDRGISAAATGGMWCCRKQGRGRPVCLQGC